MIQQSAVLEELQRKFGTSSALPLETRDGIPAVLIPRESIHAAVFHLKTVVDRPYRMLFDLTAIDERVRVNRHGPPGADFTVLYQLFSFERNAYVRLKVPLGGDTPHLPTITDVWPSANWYEREVWDMFGIV